MPGGWWTVAPTLFLSRCGTPSRGLGGLGDGDHPDAEAASRAPGATGRRGVPGILLATPAAGGVAGPWGTVDNILLGGLVWAVLMGEPMYVQNLLKRVYKSSIQLRDEIAMFVT